MIKKLALTTGGIIAASTFSVSAGGFELSPLSTAFMYETGGYAEMSYSTRDYNVTGSNYAPTGSAVGDQSHAAFAFKFDLSEDFSLGFTRYRQGSIQLDYSGAGSVFAAGLPVVSLDIDASVLLGRYKFNDK